MQVIIELKSDCITRTLKNLFMTLKNENNDLKKLGNTDINKKI